MSRGWPLVGRAEEVALCRRAIAPKGGSGGMLLAGAAGVGKTRLARELFDDALRSGRRCHWVGAARSASRVPLGAFAAFAGSLGADPLHRIQDVIDALTLGNPGPRTLVVIDDAHLLDDLSALLVHQLVSRKAATVVLTVRTGESLPATVAALVKDLTRIDLQALSAGEVEGLLELVLHGSLESATAQRLWQYTRGNMLYLNQLVNDELAQGRLSRRAGIWVWSGHPEVSQTLMDLIDLNMGRRDEAVLEVLDAVAIAEPVELVVLQSLTAEGAIDAAQTAGLVDVDADVVRLGHPMFGEARRTRQGTLRRMRLAREIADAIATLCESSPHQLVRRAMLTAGSDGPDDATMLLEASNAAMYLLNPTLAVQFTERAVGCGGGSQAKLAHALALIIALRPADGEQVLVDLEPMVVSAEEQAQLGLYRASNLAWNLGSPNRAEAVLDAGRAAAAACGLSSSYDALRASLIAERGDVTAAVLEAEKCLTAAGMHATSKMVCYWGLTSAHGDLGDVRSMSEAAAEGYAFARADPEASHLRFGLGIAHVDSLRLVGELSELSATAEELLRDARDVPATLSATSTLFGLAALGRGRLAVAQRWFRESMASTETAVASTEMSSVWLALSLAMAGDHHAARRQLIDGPTIFAEEFVLWDPYREIASAWADAAQGFISSAVRQVLAASVPLRRQNRFARELWCLQTATQFGDTTSVARLAELAQVAGGPRAPVAALHAAALAGGDGDRLMDASRGYEEFGDLVAAGDAAAQACNALRDKGFKGSSLTVAATAARLAEATGARTPAQRSMLLPELTARQIEIVALSASGLSLRQIAEGLGVSVRSVEGHIYRACQRAGVSSRPELVEFFVKRAGS